MTWNFSQRRNRLQAKAPSTRTDVKHCLHYCVFTDPVGVFDRRNNFGLITPHSWPIFPTCKIFKDFRVREQLACDLEMVQMNKTEASTSRLSSPCPNRLRWPPGGHPFRPVCTKLVMRPRPALPCLGLERTDVRTCVLWNPYTACSNGYILTPVVRLPGAACV